MNDSSLARYAALARRAHELLEEAVQPLPAPPADRLSAEVPELLADAVCRLALYEAAMPGADASALPELGSLLDALERELEAREPRSRQAADTDEAAAVAVIPAVATTPTVATTRELAASPKPVALEKVVAEHR